MKRLFSELNGFVIFDPVVLNNYLRDNNLDNDDILSYLINSEHGDKIVKLGIVIPILNLPTDYYAFEKGFHEVINELKKSEGWVMNSLSGICQIIGVGYLKDKTSIVDAPNITINLKKGCYRVSITSFYSSLNTPTFMLNFILLDNEAQSCGDIETDYGFEY